MELLFFSGFLRLLLLLFFTIAFFFFFSGLFLSFEPVLPPLHWVLGSEIALINFFVVVFGRRLCLLGLFLLAFFDILFLEVFNVFSVFGQNLISQLLLEDVKALAVFELFLFRDRLDFFICELEDLEEYGRDPILFDDFLCLGDFLPELLNEIPHVVEVAVVNSRDGFTAEFLEDSVFLLSFAHDDSLLLVVVVLVILG